MIAAEENSSPEVISALIEAGANVNARDEKGNTPLMRAASKSSDPKVITTLIRAGADVKARNENGSTLLHDAAFSPNLEITTTLIKAGLDVNARNKNGVTPIKFAAGHNPNPEVIKALVKAGANVNERSKFGETLLISAAVFNVNPEVIKTLLEFGVNPKIKDNEGKMAIDYAKENKDLKNTEAYWILNDVSYNSVTHTTPSKTDTRDNIIGWGTVTGNNVNCRERPNTSSHVKTQLSNGTRLEVLRMVDGAEYPWYCVKLHDGEGWIYGQFLVYKPKQN